MSFESAAKLLPLPLLIALVCTAGCGEQALPESSADQRASAGAPDEQAPPLDTPPGETLIPAHLVHPPADPRVALAKALEAGLLENRASQNDKLRAVLQAAGVAEASQVLVFSKTSLQDRLITPTRPRAIYFNDDCYIGYVPGGVFEYGDADSDTAVGSGFFAMDPDDGPDARLTTNSTCLNCHSGSRTNNRPGFLIRSVFPDKQGFPITSAGSTLVGHDTPIEKRWGGWYVTGEHGKLRHMGNTTTVETDNGQNIAFDREPGANVTDLSPYFNTKNYLQPTSDIVALMVLEHQVQMHNLLTQGAAVVHEQTERSRALADYLKEPFDPAKSDTLQRVIHANAQRIVEYLLYCEEIALDEPVVGSDAYQQSFRANRREDSAGRSLKDFDLQTRLFKYRCSYMVYSRAFDLMPELLMDAVNAKLSAVLTGRETSEDFAHLDQAERQAIRTILSETTDWYRDPSPASPDR